jgi:hypothetical protein
MVILYALERENRCFKLTIAERDLADLALNNLSSYIREKLDVTLT